MAKDTGGELYENFNDPKVAMGQMLRRTGVTYVLAIQPDNLKLDGDYHRLRVELKGRRAARGWSTGRATTRPGRSPSRTPLETAARRRQTSVGGEESGTVPGRGAGGAVPGRGGRRGRPTCRC